MAPPILKLCPLTSWSRRGDQIAVHLPRKSDLVRGMKVPSLDQYEKSGRWGGASRVHSRCAFSAAAGERLGGPQIVRSAPRSREVLVHGIRSVTHSEPLRTVEGANSMLVPLVTLMAGSNEEFDRGRSSPRRQHPQKAQSAAALIALSRGSFGSRNVMRAFRWSRVTGDLGGFWGRGARAEAPFLTWETKSEPPFQSALLMICQARRPDIQEEIVLPVVCQEG